MNPPPKDDGRPNPFPRDDEVPSAVGALLVGNCNLSPVPEDDGRLSPFPRDDVAPSAAPIFKDDDDEVIGAGIEKLSVGCVTCELLELAVDLTLLKLNTGVAVPTSDGTLGTVKLLLLTAEDALGCVLMGLIRATTGKTTDGC